MSNWTTSKLSDVIEIIGGGTPKRSENKYWNGDIPWLSVADFNNDFRYVNDSIEHITELGLQKSSTKLLDKDHLIISARGTVGCLAQLSVPMAFNQSCYGLNGKEGIIDNGFLYYFLKNNISELKQKTHGAVFDTITRDTFEHIQISYPDLGTQKGIAKNLGSFDDKIQLNTQINQTLEQIAQALFKSWFVDFDPVRAKVQALSDGLSLEQAELAAMQAISGKTPEELTALSQTQPDRYAELAETAKAFPCDMVEVDGVEVPKGWKQITLSEICEMQNGYAFKSSEWTDSGIPVIKIGSIQSKILTVEGNGFVSEDNLSLRSNFVLNDRDIVIGLTGAYVGKVGRMPANKKAMLNQRVAKFLAKRINESETFYSFIYMNVIQEEFKNFVDFTAQGSAQPNISTKDILKYPLLLANNEVHLSFEKLLKKILDKSIFNSYQNEILSNSRDLLLPKLLNGES